MGMDIIDTFRSHDSAADTGLDWLHSGKQGNRADSNLRECLSYLCVCDVEHGIPEEKKERQNPLLGMGKESIAEYLFGILTGLTTLMAGR